MQTRDDWLWLLGKAAGLYLVLAAVEALPALIDTVLARKGSEDLLGRRVFLEVAVPLAAGAFLLLRRTPLMSGPSAAATTPTPAASAMARADWLWIGCKLIGLWVAVNGMVQLPSAWSMVDHAPSMMSVFVTLSVLLQTGLGLWLFFGSRLWRLAASR